MTCPQPEACRRCGRPLPPRRAHAPARRLYCSRNCASLTQQARALARAREAGADPMRLIRALREETEPGRCAFCDERIPDSPRAHRRFRCDSPDCLKGYRNAYAAARRNPPEEARD